MQLREEVHSIKKYCCLCGKELIGFGNNAEPVDSGRCCDECNYAYVIPVRMAMMNIDIGNK